MTKISAQVVADSISVYGDRITSLVLTFPRYILAEFNTHRVFSRNSASSRAIPFKKMVEAVQKDPFMPMAWMKDHSGMQGKEYLDSGQIFGCEATWKVARDYAVQQATILNERHKLTKQMANRLLEPFMWHTVIVTSTDWENFFAQRANEGADIHMQELAYRMLEAMNNSIPVKKREGEWHIPFVDDIDTARLALVVPVKETFHPHEWPSMALVKVATARCARTSYTLPGSVAKDDYAEDIALHDRLWKYPHPSPFEHCAQVPVDGEPLYETKRGNFTGWKQYRKMLEGENQHDSRLIKWELHNDVPYPITPTSKTV
jgi:thymidylate synthase ThyX